MSLANQNLEQLFAAAKSLPGELSLKEVELVFLNPAPLPPAIPWYGSYLKFFIMLSFLLAAVLTFTVTTASVNPILSAFPVYVATAAPQTTAVSSPSIPIVTGMQSESPTASALPSLISSALLPATPALKRKPVPAAAPKSTEVYTTGQEKRPLSFDPVMDRGTEQREQQLGEASAPPFLPLRSTTLPLQEVVVDSFPADDSVRPANQEVDEKMITRYNDPSSDSALNLELAPEPPITTEAFVPVKWGLQQAGYMADTIRTCSRNDRTCTMQLKLKGKFRLKLNPKMSEEHMILYARPETIAAMVTKDRFRKMTLRNLLKDQAIDVEINPKGLVGLRLKENVELIDNE